MGKKYLVIIDPTSYGVDLIKACNKLGIEVFGVFCYIDSLNEVKHLAPNLVYAKQADVSQWLEFLPPVEDIVGVTAGCELAMEKAATLANIVQKGRYNSVDTVLACRNKGLMRQRLQENKLSVPKFRIVNDKSKIEEAVAEIGFPLIIKPIDQGGSIHVRLVNNSSELEESIDLIERRGFLDYFPGKSKMQYPNSGAFIIEEVMTGPEFSVDSFTVNGETVFSCVTEKVTTGAPLFIETAHYTPTLNYTSIENELIGFVNNVISALGVQQGATHCEVMYTDEGPKVVEIAARNAGDNITKLINNAFGVNLFEATVLNAIGHDPDLKIKKRNASAIKFLSMQKEGIVESLELDKRELSQSAHVSEFCLNVEKGQKVRPLKTIFDRLGYIICTGRTPSEATENLEDAFSGINIAIC